MSYHHITRKERGIISLLNHNGIPEKVIAMRLCRSISTINREIRRNQIDGKYQAVKAHEQCIKRRANTYRNKLQKKVELSTYITDKLFMTWSPEQIAGRLPLDYPSDPSMRVSHSSIYRWLHQELLTQAAELKINLRHYGHRHGETRGKLNGVRELKDRSRVALKRKRLGDWEVDTIVSWEQQRHPECLLSLCDRKSRFCGLVLLKHKRSLDVMRGFKFFFSNGKLPLMTITSDRGREFACYLEAEDSLKIPFYFTRPHSPWQKGSVENMNGLVRQFFPKGTNFNEIDQDSVSRVMDLLNNRPRKVLGFKTPAEVLHFT